MKKSDFKFTPRQNSVALLLSQGMARKEIAGKLGISVYTVSAHLEIIRIKTGTDSMNAARCILARHFPSS